MSSVNVKLAVYAAFEECISEEREMVIVCWVNGRMAAWRDFPSMVDRHEWRV